MGDCYIRGFSKSIIKTFCYTFEWADEKTQKKLHELRLTWNEVFSKSRLYSLDKQVHQLDPAWPIMMSDKKSRPNINTSKNKKRYYISMNIGSYFKRNNKGMYALDTFELNEECNNTELDTPITLGRNRKTC